MFKSLAILTLLQVIAAACDTDLKMTVVERPKLSEEYCMSHPDRYGCADFMDSVQKEKAFKIEQTSTINSYQDRVVKLYGGSFDEHLKVTIEGQDVPVFKVSDAEAFFVTPNFDSPGLKTAVLKRLARSIEFKLFILADASIDPASVSEPSQLCEGTEFMMDDGSIALGTKACANTVSAVNCSEDGEVGCITTPIFTAADTTSAASKILAGETIGGVEGNVALPAASNVMSGEVFGAAGQALIGTLTLPAAGKVLSGTSYGVGGNGLAGSLTVPAAGNVLSGSGTYGDALALITPTLTLPNSSKVLTGTSFGVSGSTSSGALTLPSAGNVLAGSGSYGDSLSQTSPTYVCPYYVRPASPNITSINFNLTPDRVTVNWGAVSEAAGYIVIMRSNAAVTWTPTDGQSYGTGAQGSDTIIYSGTGTTVTHNTDVTAGITYSFAVYSYIANNIYSYLPSTSSLTSCAGLSGSWVAVPGDSTYGTSGFCVMKYEAKNVGGLATSAASGTPWVSISQTAAQDACSSLGANFHLITNDEWMSLATNIASTANNWSGGTVGSGTINRGHSDNNPGSACAASTDDSFGYVETDCTPLNSGTWSQKRTHTLSTGAVIWDVAGNAWDWTSYVISNNSAKPFVSGDGSPQNAWKELSAVNAGFTAMTLNMLRPIYAEKIFWSDSWNSTQGVGQYYAGLNGSGGALLRGAPWNDGANAGVFSAALSTSPASSHSGIGFRCARVASP